MDSTGTESVGDVLRLFGAEDSISGDGSNTSGHCCCSIQTNEAGYLKRLRGYSLRRVHFTSNVVLKLDASW